MNNYFKDQVTESDIRHAKLKAKKELIEVVIFAVVILSVVGAFAIIQTLFEAAL